MTKLKEAPAATGASSTIHFFMHWNEKPQHTTHFPGDDQIDKEKAWTICSKEIKLRLDKKDAPIIHEKRKSLALSEVYKTQN